ncbi:glutamate receptor U1-like [Oratosquilla oratoria]|uniref:glutamate receptor U1-like n=1 Tax=Oratosquilla oratoria TaxID=337810 RepID=UPI003F75EFB3
MKVSAFVYDVRDFVEAPAPGATPLQHRKEGQGVEGKAIFCVAYVMFVEKSLASLALHHIPRGDWFQGSTRYFVSYTGESLSLQELEDDPVFFKTYDTLFLSPDPDFDKNEPREWRYDLFSNCVQHICVGILTKKLLSSFYNFFFFLSAVCPFCNNGNPVVSLTNKWDPVRGYMKPDIQLFPDSFRSFNGHLFRGVSLDFVPFMEYTGGSEFEPVNRIDCLDLRIMDTIAQHLNFSFDVYLPADRQWGTQLPNGSFNGIIGTIAKYEADFSMDISITYDRGVHVDFTRGYTMDPLVVIMSKPKPLPQWLSLVRPYQPLVWLCFLTALVAAGPSYWALQRVSVIDKPSSLSHACFTMYAAMLTQSRHWPKNTGLRIFISLWLLFGLVVTTSYIGNLTAFLTVPASSPTVNSLEELARSDFTWGVRNNGMADYQLFKFSKEPLYRTIFEGLDLCTSLYACVQRTLDEHYAFITWKTHVRDAIARKFIDKNGNPKVHIARRGFFPGPIGFTLQKGSPLKRNFDGVIQRLTEAGLVNMWLADLIHKHSRDALKEMKEAALMAAEGATPEDGDAAEEALDEVENSRQQALTTHHLQGVFLLFAVGIILSFVVLLLEVITSAYAQD